jgi:L-ascorbate metabolism protein UlaG (beta-lactamase superfamily)
VTPGCLRAVAPTLEKIHGPTECAVTIGGAAGMRVRWYGQSAFHLTTQEVEVFIDPFGAMDGAPIRFEYPPISDVRADLLLVTHEHRDHNAIEVVGGEPVVIRSQAGTFSSPAGEVVGVASEHDELAGTQRGANVLFVIELDGLRVAHLGDLGQLELRPEQVGALGKVDLLILPVGGGPTIGTEQATQIVGLLEPRWVIPMHYRTEAIDFLEPADAFLARFEQVLKLPGSELDSRQLPDGEGSPTVVIPAPPLRV